MRVEAQSPRWQTADDVDTLDTSERPPALLTSTPQKHSYVSLGLQYATQCNTQEHQVGSQP
jgi:hypothetical protein